MSERQRVTAADWPDVVAVDGDCRIAASSAGRFYVQRRNPDGSFRLVGWCASEAEALRRLVLVADMPEPEPEPPPAGLPAGSRALVAEDGRARVVVSAERDAYCVEWRTRAGVWRSVGSAASRRELLQLVMLPRQHGRGRWVVRSVALRIVCMALPERPADWRPA